MSEVRDNEKYADSDEAASQKPIIYERPTGIKGIYFHPVTQVI